MTSSRNFLKPVDADSFERAMNTLARRNTEVKHRDGAYHALITLWKEKKLSENERTRTIEAFVVARKAGDIRSKVSSRLFRDVKDLQDSVDEKVGIKTTVV